MKNNLGQYADILISSSIFAGVDREMLLELLERMKARVEHYEKGEFIFYRGDFIRELGIVLEGMVVTSFIDADGGETNVNMILPGRELVGYLAFTGGQRNLMDVYAGDRSTVLFLDVMQLREQTRYNPAEWQFLNNLLKEFADRCADLYQKVQIFGQRHIRSRVRLYLMSCAAESDVVELPINRTKLAEYLGVDRTALSREIKKMQQDRLIEVDRRQVRLLDREYFQLDRR